MYDTKYECRYHKDDVFLETDVISEDEKEFVRNVLYREDLLNIFDIDDDEVFNNFAVMSELYNLIYKCNELSECMRLAASKMISDDENVGLCILFSYDYMHLTHKCISSFLENGVINTEYYTLLKDNLMV
jgi:hypothetical protein